MNRNLRQKYRTCRGQGAGFTLLELVMSITLLAMIVAILAGAIRLGNRSVNTGEQKILSLERFRSSLAFVDAQIQSRVSRTYQEEDAESAGFAGDSHSMEFSSNRSIWSGRRGYVAVSYKIETDNRGKQTLHATERVAGTKEGNETNLFEGYDKISFEYFVHDPTEEEGEWVEQWTDDAAVPEKVRLHLTLGAREYVLLIPIRVAALPTGK